MANEGIVMTDEDKYALQEIGCTIIFFILLPGIVLVVCKMVGVWLWRLIWG